jgi:anion-transporting  ArsA/GET3 family ATPase
LAIRRPFTYNACVPAPQLVLVTGKGGTGKTTVTAALGISAARRKRRVLIVELAADRGLAGLFGREHLPTTPIELGPNLDALRVDGRALLEAYFTRILRVSFLTRRLFSSITFNAVTTAAPGVTEFLILDHLLHWLDVGRLRRARYDLVIVDAPATGHALRLLRTPRQLLRMVPAGPIATTSRRMAELIADHRRTRVVLVAIPDEMAVNEAIEAEATMRGELSLRVSAPVLNRVVGRRFTKEESPAIIEHAGVNGNDPLIAAAQLNVAAREEAERHIARLRKVFGTPPITLPQICSDGLHHEDLDGAAELVGACLGDR